MKGEVVERDKSESAVLWSKDVRVGKDITDNMNSPTLPISTHEETEFQRNYVT